MRRILMLVAVFLAVIVPSARAMSLGNVLEDPKKLGAAIAVIQAVSGVSKSELKSFDKLADEELRDQVGFTADGLTRVRKVVDRLGGKDLEARVLNSRELNAMASYKHVYITEGLLSRLNDDELAGVFGHEMAHIDKGHLKSSLKRMRTAQGLGGALSLSNADDKVQAGVLIGSVLTNLRYSRGQEQEADRLGSQKAFNAGFRRDGLMNALRKLDDNGGGFLSSHPGTKSRIKALSEQSYELVPVVLVELDGGSITTDGNASGWFNQETLAASVREATTNSGVVLFAVSGRQYDQVTTSQDRIHDSGRYRDANVASKSQMITPTARFSVSIISNLKTDNFNAGKWGNGASLTNARVKTTVVLEDNGIANGLGRKSYKETGEASGKTNVNVSSWNFGSYGQSSSGGKDELIGTERF